MASSDDPTGAHHVPHYDFLFCLAGYVVVSTGLALAWIVALRHHRVKLHRATQARYARDGLLVSSWWPAWLRKPISFLVFNFVLLPNACLLLGMVFAGVLSLFEGWSWPTGIEYVITNMVDMATPLTPVVPQTTFGKLVDLVINAYSSVCTTLATGLAAAFVFVSDMADGIPASFRALMAYMFLALPAFVMLVSLFAGALLAVIEDWTIMEGFLFMACNYLGVATPLTSRYSRTPWGQVFDALAVFMEISIGGAIIGIIGAHPLMTEIVYILEGRSAQDVVGQTWHYSRPYDFLFLAHPKVDNVREEVGRDDLTSPVAGRELSVNQDSSDDCSTSE